MVLPKVTTWPKIRKHSRWLDLTKIRIPLFKFKQNLYSVIKKLYLSKQLQDPPQQDLTRCIFLFQGKTLTRRPFARKKRKHDRRPRMVGFTRPTIRASKKNQQHTQCSNNLKLPCTTTFSKIDPGGTSIVLPSVATMITVPFRTTPRPRFTAPVMVK